MFYCIDKAAGITTRLAASKLLQIKGRGFGVEGILDPFASGLVIAATGNSTRFLSYFLRLEKCYVGELTLGTETDTLDNTGSVTKTMPVPVLGKSLLADISARFVGKLPQVPPLFSNVQIAGRRGHEIARAGEKAELKPRMVTIHALHLCAISANRLRLECRVSAGTYIRSLARDIASALGTCGHLSALRRTAIGPFSVGTNNAPAGSDGVIIAQMGDAEALSFFPSLDLTEDVARRFYQGQSPLVASATEEGVRRIFIAGVFGGLGRLERGRLRVEKIYPQGSVFP